VTDTIIILNEQTLKNQLGELVRTSVEETLNKMLDAKRISSPMQPGTKEMQGEKTPAPATISANLLPRQVK